MSGWTLVFQTINFLILAAVLYRFLFKPVSRIVARRQEEAASLSLEAEQAKQGAEEARQHYEQEIAKLPEERERVLDEARKLADKDREERLAKAGVEAEGIIGAGRATLDQERKDAAQELSKQARILAVEVARHILTEAAADSTAELFLTRMCEHLETLPVERVQSLREELSGGKALVLAVAPPLGEEAQARWTLRVGKYFDSSNAVQVVGDSELVAGVELRLPHTTFSFSWRDGLDRAAKECLPDANAH